MTLDVAADLAAALAHRYELRGRLGQGGMATVYLAHDRKHHRDVALKVLLPTIAAQLGVERFLTEIRIAARLTHPRILSLHDSGEAGGFLYYVMPYIDGASLRQRIQGRDPMSVDQALAIAAPVADGLAYAHRMGIYHRDIKPENILFAEGHPIVADFGIAKAIRTAGGANLTRTGFPLGTPGYMSPEQANGLTDLDERTDVYSLAVVIYEMLVGALPAPWPGSEAVHAGRFLDAPATHRVRLDALGDRIEAALVRGLALRRELRTATPVALIQDLSGAGPVDPARRFSEGEVREIVRRAVEREAAIPPPTTSGSMTLSEIEALAGEVGIPPEIVREAARQLPARRKAPGALIPLEHPPRELSGATAARFRAVAYSPWQMMDSNWHEQARWSLFDVVTVVFFSIITAGVLPLVFVGESRARRRRLAAFFRDAEVGDAEIVDFKDEDIAFGAKLARVRYEFEAGGRKHRGSDLVHPRIADRWRAGDRIEILYLPARNYDSVIVGGH